MQQEMMEVTSGTVKTYKAPVSSPPTSILSFYQSNAQMTMSKTQSTDDKITTILLPLPLP